MMKMVMMVIDDDQCYMMVGWLVGWWCDGGLMMTISRWLECSILLVLWLYFTWLYTIDTWWLWLLRMVIKDKFLFKTHHLLSTCFETTNYCFCSICRFNFSFSENFSEISVIGLIGISRLLCSVRLRPQTYFMLRNWFLKTYCYRKMIHLYLRTVNLSS